MFFCWSGRLPLLLLPLVLLYLFPSALGSPSAFCVRHDQQNEIRPCRHLQSRGHKPTAENKIHIDFKCYASDAEECHKANATFIAAGELISAVLEFKTPIYVNATYLPFCEKLGECSTTKGIRAIGQAYPAVSYLMTDRTDNTTRMYPQAILKQYTYIPIRPQWYSYDMNAQFNSDVAWYFANDTYPITQHQTDLLRTTIHEFLHGLGFVSSWNADLHERLLPYFPSLTNFLTPKSLIPPNELAAMSKNLQDSQGAQPFWGFVEFPFDKLLVHNGQPLTNITHALNSWYGGNVLFGSILDMVNAWYASDVRASAENVYKMGTTPRDVAIVINSTTLWVETSLVPFAGGSSFSHVDLELYQSSADYLMVYDASPGVDIATLTRLYSHGPIGPKLIQTLIGLGYVVRGHPLPKRPYLSYWNPPEELVGTTTNPSPPVRVFSDGPAQWPTTKETAVRSGASGLVLPYKLICGPIMALLLAVWTAI
ncbi:hypothetical protein DFQ28_002514 [Apophysomyces sp. BC1034]|nr:hypothetical protein DFQ30_002890 [Apophysomyces sp. BC1015]KAG0179641.1 hypothetical protein DFQ29_001842 [Apophysomyces sp. BC1021]KAG0190072.1 hypothetical protein DFQ28_002514 [Apophysomyces sp. BC1034]